MKPLPKLTGVFEISKMYPTTRINLQQKIVTIIREEFYKGGEAEKRIAERIADIVYNNYRRRKKA